MLSGSPPFSPRDIISLQETLDTADYDSALNSIDYSALNLSEETLRFMHLGKTAEDKYFLLRLPYADKPCIIEIRVGFRCPGGVERRSQDEGFLYVSEWIGDEDPYMLLFLVETAPRASYIYRVSRTG